WLPKAEIPADRSSFGAFAALAENAEKDLREILDAVAAGKPEPGSEAQKLADAYTSFLDEKTADELGVTPIAAELAQVEQIETKADLARTRGALRRLGVSGAIRIGVSVDPKEPLAHVVSLGQDGLGLPDRDYYLKPRYADKLGLYAPYLAHLLELSGKADATA